MIDCVFQLESGFWVCQTCRWKYPRESEKPPRRNCPKKLTPEARAQREAAMAEQAKLDKHFHAKGPGHYLHLLLKKITGEGITASCGCKSHIAEMNRRGPEWCRENVETIVGWLEEEIERRYRGGVNPSWRLKLAAWKLPGQRPAMRRVIMLAVKLAERKLQQNDGGGRSQ